MTHEHEHRDFVCRDCGALITCLSCIEVRAGTLPRGPAFVNFHLQPPEMAPKPEFETIGVNNDSDPQARETATLLPPALPQHQQSLFG
jgi:hypothetical protein